MKIFNITGYIDYSYSNEFYSTNSWKGQVLIDDEGWVNGIVMDNGDTKHEKIVYGIVLDKKTIELFKEDISGSNMPTVFHADFNDNSYEGVVENLNIFLMEPYGTSRIKIKPVTRNVQNSINRLQKHLDSITEEGKEPIFYNQFYRNDEFKDTIIQAYNQRHKQLIKK